jgi:hypothetical protein
MCIGYDRVSRQDHHLELQLDPNPATPTMKKSLYKSWMDTPPFSKKCAIFGTD